MSLTLSVSKGIKKFEEMEVDFSEVASLITKCNWSPAVFKDGLRNKANFVKAECFGLDVDSGLSIEQAVETFKDYACIIAPSRNHRKPKVTQSGVDRGVQDRFRVLIPLDKPITSVEEYKATFDDLLSKFSFIDESCSNADRFFYPSPSVFSVRPQGKLLTPSVPKAKEPVVTSEVTGIRGELSKGTMQFLLLGASPGSRHDSLFKAATDAHEQGYSEPEFWGMLARQPGGLWVDERRDEAKRTIRDAFSQPSRYEPRITPKAFVLKPIGEVLSTKKKLDWLVKDLLTVGGISLISGRPKSGKSTLKRQLSKAVARGESFLGRECQQGGVIDLALEEQDEMVSLQYKKLGVTKDDAIHIHTGLPETKNVIQDLEDLINELSPKLVVADTLALLLGLRDLNSYSEANLAFAPFRQLARRTGVHIMFIHHSNKGGEGFNSISGSNAIHGAVDNAMIFSVDGQRRFITSSQRGGITLENRELIFDAKTETYTLGASREEF